jgi:hypothetical protein
MLNIKFLILFLNMGLGSFQNKAVGIFFVVLLIVVIVISVILMKTKNTGSSVIINECPDYWITTNYAVPQGACKTSEYGCCTDHVTAKTDADGTNCPIKCYNAHKLGTTSSTCTSVPTEMDFSTDDYAGTTGLCNKRTWAKNCGLTWDGITDVSMTC